MRLSPRMIRVSLLCVAVIGLGVGAIIFREKLTAFVSAVGQFFHPHAFHITAPHPVQVLSAPATSFPADVHPDEHPLGLSLSDNGTFLAVLFNDRVELRNTADLGKALGTVADNYGPREVVFSEDAARLRFSGASFGQSEWNTATFARIYNRENHDRPPGSGAMGASSFDAHGTRLAMVGGGTLALYDVTNGKWLWRHVDPDLADSLLLALSSDGRTIAVSAPDRSSTKFFHANDGSPAGELSNASHQVKALAFAPDGRTLAIATAVGTIEFWDTVTGSLRGDIAFRSAPTSHSLTFSPDGHWLAVVADSPARPAAMPAVPAITTPSSRPSAALPAEAPIYIIGVFRTDTGDEPWEIHFSSTAPPNSVLASPLTGTSGVGKSPQIIYATFSPDGKTLYTVGADIALWNLRPAPWYTDVFGIPAPHKP